MKTYLLLILTALSIGLISCSKTQMEEDLGNQIAAMPGTPCQTSIQISGMAENQTLRLRKYNQSQALAATFFTNNVHSIQLETSTIYEFSTQGPNSISVSWCSCGETYDSATIDPAANNSELLRTSHSGAAFTNCGF